MAVNIVASVSVIVISVLSANAKSQLLTILSSLTINTNEQQDETSVMKNACRNTSVVVI